MRLVLLFLGSSLLACGARTSPRIGEPDAALDAGVPVDAAPPTCWEREWPGTVRGELPDVDGRPACDPGGNLYAPRRLREEDRWQLVSYDPCLELRWVRDLPAEFSGPGLGMRTSVDPTGRVWVHDRFALAQITMDGALVQPPLWIEYADRLFGWVATPAEGPIFATVNDGARDLYRVDGDRVLRTSTRPPSSGVYDEECVFASPRTLCWDVGFDGALRELYYRGDRQRIIDGTRRHLTQVAWDGRRLWTLRYGISTYQLVGREPISGRDDVVVEVARTAAGQTRMTASPPAIGPAGEVVVYFHGRSPGDRPEGFFLSVDPNGRERWVFPASRSLSSRNVFSTTASVAIGDAGVVYGAVGNFVYGIDLEDGTERWRTFTDLDLDDPDLQLSPLGDLALRDDDGVLTIVATESTGLADSPWPIAGGDSGANYVAR